MVKIRCFDIKCNHLDKVGFCVLPEIEIDGRDQCTRVSYISPARFRGYGRSRGHPVIE